MDWVIVVNDNDEEVGTMLRPEAHQNGTPHRIVVTYVTNDIGQIVVQVRKNGSLDHSSAGHVDPGESYADAAVRELTEELGIVDVDLKKVDHGSSCEEHDAGVTRHEFDIFVCNADYKELGVDEVIDAYWADPEAIWLDMKSDPTNVKYAGGFRASLPIFLAWRRHSTSV